MPSAGPGDLRVKLRLTRSPVGPSPSLVDRSAGIQSLALAMEALALVGLEGAPDDERLAAALAVEGVLAWFHDASPGHRPPAQAMGYALAYAAARLEGAGRAAPAALTHAGAGLRTRARPARRGARRRTGARVVRLVDRN